LLPAGHNPFQGFFFWPDSLVDDDAQRRLRHPDHSGEIFLRNPGIVKNFNDYCP
jgi:hypothetical protein